MRFRGKVWGEVWESFGCEVSGVSRFKDTDHDLIVTRTESVAYHELSLWLVLSNGDLKSPFMVSWAVKHGIPGKLEPNFTPYLK